MSRAMNVGLSLAAGLLGGVLSHYVSPESVHAQLKAAFPKEIAAQSFVLVNEKGRVIRNIRILKAISSWVSVTPDTRLRPR
jgi:hypothetical protein